MEWLQKCVQVNGKYVRCAKRTQYIEIDFNREIRLCYTWRGTPYSHCHPAVPALFSYQKDLPDSFRIWTWLQIFSPIGASVDWRGIQLSAKLPADN
jgi:hypothetical protein